MKSLRKLRKVVAFLMAFAMVLSVVSVTTKESKAGGYEYKRFIDETVYAEIGGDLTLTPDISSVTDYGVTSRRWMIDGEVVEGATEATYTLTDIQSAMNVKSINYTENYDTIVVNYNVAIENGFTVQGEGKITSKTVKVGEQIELSVNAEVADGELSYAWYQVVDSRENGELEGVYDDTLEDLGLTTASVKFDGNTATYRCIITDKYNNTKYKDIKVTIDNSFSAVAVGSSKVAFLPGETHILEVDAKCNVGEISYQWYMGSSQKWGYIMEGETSNKLEVTHELIAELIEMAKENPEAFEPDREDSEDGSEDDSEYDADKGGMGFAGYYTCVVKDEYGNEEEVSFYVYVENGLKCKREEPVYVEYGGSVTLDPEASCNNGELTYIWRKNGADITDEETGNQYHGSTLTVNNVTENATYICTVYDQYDNQKNCDFYVCVKNELKVQEDEFISAKEGDTVTLTCEASCKEGELTYEWKKDIYSDEILSTEKTLEIEAQSGINYYYCTVTDKYGNSKEVKFTVMAISLGQDKVYLVSWNSEMGNYLEAFLLKYPEYEDKIEYVNYNTSGTESEYKDTLKAVVSSDSRVIFAFDEYIADYVKQQLDFIPVSKVGITNGAYANAYPYTKELGTVDGQLSFLAWQSCISDLVYRTDIALEVFGTDDPLEIEAMLDTPEEFIEACKTLKAEGYYMFSDNPYYSSFFDEMESENIEITEEIIKQYLQITNGVFDREEIDNILALGKTLYDNEYTKNNDTWSTDWSNDMKGNDVFAYRGVYWFERWTYPMNANDYVLANVDLCKGPIENYWGGTYVGVNAACEGDETVEAVLRTLFCDEEFMAEYCGEQSMVPNNHKATQSLISDDVNNIIQTKSGTNAYEFYDRLSMSYRADKYVEPELEEYTITYVLNGGTNNAKNPDVYTEGSTVPLYSPTRSGYTFLGWYTDAAFDSSSRITKITSDMADNITVYARWAKAYKITYVLDGGVNNKSNPSSYTKYENVVFKEPTKDNYIFLGWYTDAKFTNKITQIKAGSVGDKTIYAKWVKQRKAPTITAVTSHLKGAKLTWQTVAGATKYRILRYDATSKKWVTIKLIAAAKGTTNYYYDKNVTSGKTYKYAIRCMNDDNVNISTLSNQVSLKFIGTPVISSAKPGTSGIVLKWNKPAGSVKYAVYRRAVGGDWKIHGYTTSTTYLDKTAKKGNMYAYTIQCVDAKNNPVSGIDKVNVVKVVYK